MLIAREYCTKMTIWNRTLIRDLDLVSEVKHPTPFLTDNQRSMGLVRNESLNRRTKHIDVKYLYTRNAIHDTHIKPRFRSTEDTVADIMTKRLGRIKMKKFVGMYGLRKNGYK